MAFPVLEALSSLSMYQAVVEVSWSGATENEARELGAATSGTGLS